jgi:AAA+ ATPase superfamily predicted ATPase
VSGEYFTDRADELKTIRRAMQDGGRLLVTGPRRMGKSTVIRAAAERVQARGAVVLIADLATTASLTEIANRLLAAVAATESWSRRLTEWAKALGPVVTLGFDDAGRPRLGVGLESRPRREEDERVLLERVLDRVEAVASAEPGRVVVVLDEFQRLAELGGETAEWLLRNRMQENSATGFVCAGSKESLIADMLQPKRAFYRFFETLHVGPIDAAHLALWIDDRLSTSGVDPGDGVGAALLARMGPRTQDVMQAARVLWFRCAGQGVIGPNAVDEAIAEIVAQDDPALRRTWEDLTPPQQRLLRAVAAGESALHSAEVRERHALGPSSSVSTALDALTSRAILTRQGDRVVFENPYFREWARRELL